MEAIPTVAAKLRGEEVPRNCLIHCGATVVMFSLGTMFPDDHPINPMHSESGVQMTDVEALAFRELQLHMPECFPMQAGAESGRSYAVDWKALGKKLLELLALWLL